MSRSWNSKTGYVSEFTAFMENFLAEHPEEIQEQRRGWAIFWNHKMDFDEMKKAAGDSVPTEGYYYGGSAKHPESGKK